jgi:thiamine kinase-like enzyme
MGDESTPTETKKAHRLTPDEAVARIADWQGKDIRWEELGGGITNHNYIVWVNGGWGNPGGGKYVLRVPGAGTDMFIDRDLERECMIEAARVGVAPAVAHVIEPEKAMAIVFVDGELMHGDTMAGHPERIKQAVEQVKVFHKNAVFSHKIDLFQMLRDYTKVAREINAPMPERLAAMLKVMADIEEATARDPVPDVACHNDLLSENFIIDANGKMWIIDWEYGGMTDPYFDLGDFVMEHPYSREEERLIIETYCGGMDERLFGRMMLYKIVSAIWWAVWAMIQHTVSKIDFDYMEWGMERVGRAERGVADPDYPQWLADQ